MSWTLIALVCQLGDCGIVTNTYKYQQDCAAALEYIETTSEDDYHAACIPTVEGYEAFDLKDWRKE